MLHTSVQILRMAKGSNRRKKKNNNKNSAWQSDKWWSPQKKGKWSKAKKKPQSSHVHVWPLHSKAQNCDCDGLFIDFKGRLAAEFWCLGREWAIVFIKQII